MTAAHEANSEQRSEWAKMNKAIRENRIINVNPDELTFGIEIECFVPHASLLHYGIEVGSYSGGYTISTTGFPSGWKASADSSLKNSFGGDYRGVEFVSPVLRGLEGLTQAAEMAALIKGLGGKVNDTCGCHVHVGVPSVLGNRANDFDLVSNFIVRLLHLSMKHEYALLAMNGNRSRIGNRYCQTIKEVWGKTKPYYKYDYFVRQVEQHRVRVGRNVEYRSHVSRYHTINLASLLEHKTVEFRVFGGTLNPSKVVNYIITAIGLCHRAAAKPDCAKADLERNEYKTNALEALEDLENELADYGWPTGAKAEYAEAVARNRKWNVNHFLTGGSNE